MSGFDRVYVWGNNERRASLKGRRCKILARGAMNTILVEFEGGERVTTSRHAVRLRTEPATTALLPEPLFTQPRRDT